MMMIMMMIMLMVMMMLLMMMPMIFFQDHHPFCMASGPPGASSLWPRRWGRRRFYNCWIQCCPPTLLQRPPQEQPWQGGGRGGADALFGTQLQLPHGRRTSGAALPAERGTVARALFWKRAPRHRPAPRATLPASHGAVTALDSPEKKWAREHEPAPHRDPHARARASCISRGRCWRTGCWKRRCSSRWRCWSCLLSRDALSRDANNLFFSWGWDTGAK